MKLGLFFFLNSVLLGLGLAMDAFSVSVANGIAEPEMRRGKACMVAGTFAGFQALMPLIGWTCVHLVEKAFAAFQKFIPWIALLLLAFIGGKMILDGLKAKAGEEMAAVGTGSLLLQGVATSIDALSVGFTTADLGFGAALISSLIIGAVTLAVCFCGVILGRKFGAKVSDKASIFGGVILIAIGIEIFVKAMFF